MEKERFRTPWGNQQRGVRNIRKNIGKFLKPGNVSTWRKIGTNQKKTSPKSSNPKQRRVLFRGRVDHVENKNKPLALKEPSHIRRGGFAVFPFFPKESPERVSFPKMINCRGNCGKLLRKT